MPSAVPRFDPNRTASGVLCRASAGNPAAVASTAGTRSGATVSAAAGPPSMCTPGRGRTWIRKSTGLIVRVVRVLSW